MDQICINFSHSLGRIDPALYGHFSEHIGGVFYDGLWVGEDSPIENIRGFRKSLVDSFRRIAPPVLRWPGGCFAETYNWRDGIGPRELRPRRMGWWYRFDHRIESNAVGTHEFMDFCHLVGAEPYIAANMTSLTPLDIQNWIEYCNMPAGLTTLSDQRAQNGSPEPFGVRYWGIGNENWGGGGEMTPEMCADEYIRYTTICDPFGTENLRFIICGANGHDLEWTRRLMKQYASRKGHAVPTYGISIHYYTSSDPQIDHMHFTEEEWYAQIARASFMQRIVDDHRIVMDEFDPQRRIKLIIDEWGNWHKDGTGPSHGYNLFEQQSNMSDACVAALTLNLFNNRCDVMGMANVAQLCNNLHSLYLAGGEHFVETPNYYVFDMFKGHQGGTQLETQVSGAVVSCRDGSNLKTLSASASVKDHVLTLTMANLDVNTGKTVQLSALGQNLCGEGTFTVLSHADPHTCNTFEEPKAVVPVQRRVHLENNGTLELPAASVCALTVKL